jgi:hypothetical protein
MPLARRWRPAVQDQNTPSMTANIAIFRSICPHHKIGDRTKIRDGKVANRPPGGNR